MIPYTPEAYQLLHDGAITLAEVECNGMAIDTDYLTKAIKRTERRVSRMQRELEASEVMRVWRKTYKGRTNINSTAQLGHVLFDKMGFTSPGQTSSGRQKVDEEALGMVDHPFVKQYLEIKKLNKAASTNLKGVLREVVDGKIHCFFNLHNARTYRSSSDSFNFQNIPIRDPVIARLVRRAFVARKGRQVVEIDISGAEVRVAACYHKDPNMISYIKDKSKDMHRDMAMELFMLPQSEVTKAIRHASKNQFVFPQFYGDWYIDCAKHLWSSLDKHDLKTTSGTAVKAHLAAKGIHELGDLDPKERPRKGTFEHHVQKVEEAFWNKRFVTYAKWKKVWYEEYKARGWIQSLTGFVCQGYMKKNEVINYPVQGSAFHCLLWSLIQLVTKEMKRRRMESLIVGQIHDSIVADVVPSELEDYLALCHNVMTRQLPKAWPWLIVPMEIEADVAPVGGSWADKKEHPIAAA